MAMALEMCVSFHITPDAPRIDSLLINEGQTSVEEGGKATFTCSVSANPPPRITWTNLDTQTIVKQDTALVSTYVIPKSGCLDTARYQCSAENNVGVHATGNIDLYVECK